MDKERKGIGLTAEESERLGDYKKKSFCNQYNLGGAIAHEALLQRIASDNSTYIMGRPGRGAGDELGPLVAGCSTEPNGSYWGIPPNASLANPGKDIKEIPNSGGMLVKQGIAGRQGCVMVAILEYTCEYEPRPQLEWFNRKWNHGPNTTAMPDGGQGGRDSMRAWARRTSVIVEPLNEEGAETQEGTVASSGQRPPTVRSRPQDGSGIPERRFRPPGGRPEKCFLALSDTPAAGKQNKKSWTIYGHVTWTLPSGVAGEAGDTVRCVRSAEIDFKGTGKGSKKVRLTYQKPGEVAEYMKENAKVDV